MLSGCCKTSPQESFKHAQLNDSSQNFMEEYYSAEDIMAYAYMNSDLNQSLSLDFIIYDSENNMIMDRDLLLKYKRYVYLPDYACESCILSLCGILKDNNFIKEIGFFISRNNSEKFEQIISKATIPMSNILYYEGSFGLPIENEQKIFMFSLSKDFHFRDIYVPDKHTEKLTDIYLNITDLKNY